MRQLKLLARNPIEDEPKKPAGEDHAKRHQNPAPPVDKIISLLLTIYGREPWSSGYGRRLASLRSWVQILAPYTGWTFFHIYLIFVVKIVMFV